MLMMRMLWMPLWSLRRARHDGTLAQPANGRAGEDDDSDLGEAEVGGGVEMNGYDDNDTGDMGYIMVVRCGDGVLVSAQSSRSEKEGATNRNIVSRRRPGPSSEYKDSRIIIIKMAGNKQGRENRSYPGRTIFQTPEICSGSLSYQLTSARSGENSCRLENNRAGQIVSVSVS